ncbi:MAG: relaxase [Pseudomonadota bacterium]
MIIKASQRGGGKQLALHLLRTDDNEHIDVHDMRGFVSSDITGAFKEAYAVSKGTKCKQFLFSVSFNPPEQERVDIKTFEAAIDKLEEKNNLQGQPRVIVFHEKEGRRHAHAVWSRIDADTMTARNLPHYKLKCRDLSREIYLEQGWKMPRGLMNSKERDPRNFNLAEWQQAKRQGLHARDLKEMMAECWAASDSKAAFQNALSERGMILAKGDRRGHVAVTHDGAVLSIARYTGKKAKEIKARLGEPDKLPSVDEAKTKIAGQMSQAVKRHIQEAKTQYKQAMAPLERRRLAMTEDHRAERAMVVQKQQIRWDQERKVRAARYRSGLSGLMQRLSGERAQIQKQNIRETVNALKRDQDQRQILINAQLTDRQKLQAEIKAVRQDHAKLLLKLRQERQQIKEITQQKNTAKGASPKRKLEIQSASQQELGRQPATSHARPAHMTPTKPQERLSKLREAYARAADPATTQTQDRLQRLRDKSSSTAQQRKPGYDHDR